MTGVAALLDEVAALAERLGHETVAGQAREQRAASAVGAACVVVVGEKKRGKSSLVNALVEAPGLLPVDVDIATSVHIVVYASHQPAAAAVTAASGPDGIASARIRSPSGPPSTQRPARCATRTCRR